MIRRLLAPLIIAMVSAFALAGCSDDTGTATPPPAAVPSGAVVVDLIYLDHAPVRPVIADVDKVLDKYAGKVAVRRHNAESGEGQRLATELGLTGHLALAIAINRAVQLDVGGRTVRFEGFPVGRSPIESAQGGWKIEDLDAVLAQRTT